jgi:uncharacterized membrane protein
MQISPEERRRIYEEEKTRIEAEQASKSGRKKTGTGSTVNLEPNVAALFCYIGLWVTGFIMLLLERENKFTRFHAIQSIIIFGFLSVAGVLLSRIPLLGPFFSAIVGVLFLVLWLVLMVNAYQGQLYRIPVAGDLALRISYGNSEAESEAWLQQEYVRSQQAPESPPPQTTPGPGSKTTLQADHSGYGRTTRITSSVFVIAWSVAFLIFFNFFSHYIAYYQLEQVVGEFTIWVKYPILTEDFNAWLPILTTALFASVAGHTVLIIFDKYVLREAISIILKVFGIVTVATLLSVFPFDFSEIPITMLAPVIPVIGTLILIIIIIGMGITIFARSVRLIVKVVMRTAHY